MRSTARGRYFYSKALAVWALTGFAWLAYFVVGGGSIGSLQVAAMMTFAAVWVSIVLLIMWMIGV